MHGPRPVAGSVRPGRLNQASQGRIWVLAVVPRHDLDRPSHRGLGGPRLLEGRDEQHRVATGAEHETRQPLELGRVVPREVAQVGSGGDEQSGQAGHLRPGRRAGHPVDEGGLHGQIFRLRICGRTSNDAGVVPRVSPSASTGRGRSPSTRICLPFSSTTFGCGTCSPLYTFGSVVNDSDFGPLKTRTSRAPSPGYERGEMRIPPPKYWQFATTTVTPRPS